MKGDDIIASPPAEWSSKPFLACLPLAHSGQSSSRSHHMNRPCRGIADRLSDNDEGLTERPPASSLEGEPAEE